MLTELSVTRTTIDHLINRFEQLGLFYLTGSTAIGGAIILVFVQGSGTLSSKSDESAPLMLVSLLLLTFAVFGSGTFFRMCASKSSIATSYTILEANRMYFLHRFSRIQPFVANRPPELKYKLWITGAFTRQVKVFLIAIGLLNSVSMTIGLGLLLSEMGFLESSTANRVQSLVVAALVLLGTSFAYGYYLYRILRRAETYNKEIIENSIAALTGSSTPASTGTNSSA